MVGMSKSRATSFREAWGHSSAPAKPSSVSAFCGGFLQRDFQAYPPLAANITSASRPQNSRELDYIFSFYYLTQISLLIQSIQ